MTTFRLSNFGRGTLLEACDGDDLILKVGADAVARLPTIGVDEAFALTLWDGHGQEEIVYCTAKLSDSLVVERGREDTASRAWLAGTEFRNALTAGTAGALMQQGFIAANKATEAEAEAGVEEQRVMTPLNTTQHFNHRTTDFTRSFLQAESDVDARRELGWSTATFSGTGLETTFTLPDDGWGTPYTKVYVDEVYIDSGYQIVGDQLIFDEPPPATAPDNILVVLGINFAFSVSFPGANTVSEDAIVDGAVTTSKIANLAVTSGKIASKAVSYGKIQDVSATDRILGRSSAGAGSIEELPFSDIAQALAALASLPEVQAYLSSTAWPVPTGTKWEGLASSAPAGYIDCYGTIGSAGSGANYANANAKALFELVWNVTSVTDCPILNSNGSAGTKGTNATADWNANKRITLPDARGVFSRGLDLGRGIDSGRALGSAQDDEIKSHNHSATFSGSALPEHSHTVTSAGSRHGFNGRIPAAWYGADGDNGNENTARSRTSSSVSAGTPSGTVSVANTGGSETRPKSVAWRVCIKL